MRRLLLVLSLILVACGPSVRTAEVDASISSTPDSGSSEDAGGSDAGERDAGDNDAGVMPDGGHPIDAGPPTDGGHPIDGGPDCASSCAGCCTSAGQCLGGTSDSACGHDGDLCGACSNGTCSSAGVCMTGQTVTGDNCTAPIVLTPDTNGEAMVTVALDSMLDDTTLSCSASGRRDAVIAFDVTANNTFIQLDALGHGASGALPVLALRDTCSDGNSEWSCQAASAQTPAATVTASLDIGRYYAWVEANGLGSVDVAFHATRSGVGDTCQLPNVLTFNGNTAQMSDDLSHYTPTNLSCSENRDATYSFTLPTDAYVTVTVTPGESFTPEIDLPTGTCNSGNVSCYVGSAPGVAKSLNVFMTAGTHAFNVTSPDGVGPYVVTVTRSSAAAADNCATASSITFTNGHAATSVPLNSLTDDFNAACLSGSSTGKDAVYHFTTTATGDFSARLSGDFSANYDVLTLRNTCTGADIACDHALAIQDLPAGDYYILVDSLPSVAATVVLDTYIAPAAAAGGSCLRPETITLSNGAAGGTAHLTGTLAGAADSFFGSCLNSGHTGVDHIYSFTIDRPLILKATGTIPTRATWDLRIANSADECTRGASTSCNEVYATSLPLVKLLAPGTYLLAVEGAITTYTLDLALSDPPSGEYCANPIDIDISAPFSDQNTTLGLLQDDNDNACAGYNLPDRVYRITTTEPFSDLRATITARNGTNAPALLLDRTNCPGFDVVMCQYSGTALTRTIQETSLPAGTYYLWVKGPNTTGADYSLSVSVKPTVSGDTCDVAFPLSFTNGVAHTTGDTTGLEDDYYACNQIAPTFADAVYSFTTDQEWDFRATMTPTSSTARGALSLLSSDCQIDSSHCLTGNAAGPVSLKVGSLPAGAHAFSVDYSSGGPGAYTLDAQLTEHQPGETCLNPLPVTFSSGAAGGTANLNLDLRDYFHDSATFCGYTGSDAFLTFTTDRTLDLRLQATPGTGTGTLKVSLVNACGGGALSCDTLYTGSWSRGSLAPGTYVVMVAVDRTNEEGPVGLSLSLTPPAPGDTCANPIDLGLPGGGGSVDVTGTTASLFDERTSSCAYDTYGDIVYSFTTTRTLSFYATLGTSTNAGSHAMYLRTAATCTGTTDLSCSAGNAAHTSVRAADLPAGTYDLIIDRASYNTPQDFSLHAWAGERPAGDTCTTALPLGLPTSGPGEVTVTGDTSGFFQDTTASCGTSTAAARSSPDTFYSFTTTATMNLRLYVQAAATGFRPTVSLRNGCGTTSDTRCAAVPTFANDAWTSYQALPAGTWYIAVDGYDSAQFGPYTLNARLSMNQMPGETCANPAPLTLSGGTSGTATASATFANYFHDYSDCWASDGADIVYAITTDRARRLHVLAEPSASTVQPDLSIRGSACSTTASALVCNRPEYDGTGRAAATIPAGTSYVLVKSPLTNPSGSVALSFAVDSFAAGDTCTQALPLTFSNGAAGGTASASGDLFTFGADATPSCGRTGAPDVFYSFTTNRTLSLSVSLTREDTSASFALALEGACASAELTCASSGFSSGPVTLTRSALPAGTYTLIVQGGAQHPAGWSLSATLQ